MVHVIADYVGNTYKLRADSHTKAIEWCRSLDMASRVSFTDQVSVCIWSNQVKYVWLFIELVSELLSITCHMGSQSIAWKPMQVNAPSVICSHGRFTYHGGI